MAFYDFITKLAMPWYVCHIFILFIYGFRISIPFITKRWDWNLNTLFLFYILFWGRFFIIHLITALFSLHTVTVNFLLCHKEHKMNIRIYYIVLGLIIIKQGIVDYFPSPHLFRIIKQVSFPRQSVLLFSKRLTRSTRWNNLWHWL